MFIAVQSQAQIRGKIRQTGQVLLPNGWKLSPVGRSLQLGDLPLNMQLSASGKLLAVTNNGESTQSVQLIDPVHEKLLDEKVVGKSWYGLAFSHDEKKLYASGGNDNWIMAFNIQNNKIGKADTIKLGQPWPKEGICPTGIAVNKTNTVLYTVTKEDSALYVVDPNTQKITANVKLPAEAYSCILSPDEKTLYISIWGGGQVVCYNTAMGAMKDVKVGSHPNELLLNKKGTCLFVANSNDCLEEFSPGRLKVPSTSNIWRCGNEMSQNVVITWSATEAMAMLACRRDQFSSLEQIQILSLGCKLSLRQCQWINANLKQRKFVLVFPGDPAGRAADIRVAMSIRNTAVKLRWEAGNVSINCRGKEFMLPERELSLAAFERAAGVRSRIRTLKPTDCNTFLEQLYENR